MDFAISFNSVVFPAFGGDTIIPRCPLPTGEIRSTIRMATFLESRSIRIRWFGKIGVISSKLHLLAASAGCMPFVLFK